MVETRVSAVPGPGPVTFHVRVSDPGAKSDIGPLITALNALARAPVVRYDSRYQDIAETDWTHGPAVILPPVNYYRLASFLATSGAHARCVNVKATHVAGDAITVRQRDPEADPDELNGAQRDALRRMIRRANPYGESLASILFRVQYDIEAIGNGYIEVVRDARGLPAALYHVPAVNIRVARGPGGRPDGYWQVEQWGLSADSSRRRSYFKRWGDTRQRYLGSGQLAPVSAGPESLASELIQFKSYNLASSFYGLPDVFPAVLAMEGDRAAAFWNADTFQYNTIPRMIITFIGGEPSEETLAKIEKHFTEMQPGRNHAPLVLYGISDAGGMAPDAARVQVDKLEHRDDAGYIQYRERNRDEVVLAHGVPPELLGIAQAKGIGGAGADDSARRNFRTMIVHPRQMNLQHALNEHIISDPELGLGIEDWVISLSDLELTDSEFALSKLEHFRKQVAAGLMTINEARTLLGMPRYDDMPIADTPFVMAPGGAWLLDRLLDPSGGGIPPAAGQAEQAAQSGQAGQAAGAALAGKSAGSE